MKRVSILGTQVSCLNYSKTISIIKQTISHKQVGYVCVAAVHLIMECFDDLRLQTSINQALCVTADGMPLVWIQKLLGNSASRVYGPELTLCLCQYAEKIGWKVFFVGGSTGEGYKMTMELHKRYPRLAIAGTFDTPVRPLPEKQNYKLVKQLNITKPELIFVGLGCPLQERWMINNRPKIRQGVMIGVGAAFDFISKTKRQAPTWVQSLGFEWFVRLIQDPKRLWKRYTVTNARFILYFLKSTLFTSIRFK